MIFSQPNKFSFKNTINSHGWSELLPFEIDKEALNLSYVFFDKSFDKPISANVSATTNTIKIDFVDNKLIKSKQEIIKQEVKHILRLNEDFSEFYEVTKLDKNFAWIAENNVCRLVRSPTVFEDLIKTICTTNCSWGLTKNMTANLVEKLGVESVEGKKAFPTVEAMANVDEEFYRKEIRAGYRSSYFVELSQAITNGTVTPEKWLETDVSTIELKKEMKQIKGVGDYAAENLLKLVGRYDGLALDSFLRSEFYKKHNNGVTCSDKEIKQFYEKFGEFRGLAIWFDMSKRWFD